MAALAGMQGSTPQLTAAAAQVDQARRAATVQPVTARNADKVAVEAAATLQAQATQAATVASQAVAEVEEAAVLRRAALAAMVPLVRL